MAATPAILAFVAAIPSSVTFGQVTITPSGDGFLLRHKLDEACANAPRQINLSQLRKLSETTESGAYRPLRSAPTLPSGWNCQVASVSELELALNALYPGAIADWYAEKMGVAATTYREYTGRQTGMYRITTFLDEPAIESMVQACCASNLCLKHRRWDISTERPAVAEKYRIPCLEPCAILLEFARKTVRMSQEKQNQIELSESEIETLLSALKKPDDDESELRDADFADPRNSRRRELLKNRLLEAQQHLEEQKDS